MIWDLISLIFPTVCAFCKTPTAKGETLLCTTCLLDLPKLHDYNNPTSALVNKFASVPKLQFAYSYLKFTKKGVAQRLLHQLKYEGNQEIGITLGRWFGTDLTSPLEKLNIDLILPVPLHPSRLRTRGYNQSDLFAEGLSEALKIDWSSTAIKRLKKTETQTKKGKVDRWKNVNDIFQVVNPKDIEGKSVILVDDVVTTGATLSACLEAIVAANVSSIGVITIARAD